MKKTILFAALAGLCNVLYAQWIPAPQPIYLNTHQGLGAFTSNVNGNYNAAFGSYALNKNTSGNYNTAVGGWALYNANATSNVAVGRRAMYNTTSGGGNTAIGTDAMYSNTYGIGNVAVGDDALRYNVTGNWNTAIGHSAGPAVGNVNLIHATAIGYAAQNTANFQVRIGHDLINDIGGQVSWSTLSDGRFKRDIKEDIAGLEFINKLRPVSYTVDHAALVRSHNIPDSIATQLQVGRKADVRQTGFVAQEVEAIIKKGNYSFNGVKAPQNDNDHYSIRYAEFVVPLVKAVQELTTQLNEQKLEITALKQKLSRAEEGTSADINSNMNIVLFQNNPNPFSSDTEIKMALPETTQQATLILYNMEGKQLKNFQVNERGNASVKISGNDFNAGIYLYALIVDGKVVDTKRLILTK